MLEQQIAFIPVFLAGLTSFFSPCIVPLLPAYLALLTKQDKDNGKGNNVNLFKNAMLFWAGFTCVFIAMGATASYFGQLLAEYQEIIRKIGAIFIIAMGIHLTGFMRVPMLNRELRPLLNKVFTGPAAAFLLGMAFTLGWTPCTGPILASVLLYAGTMSSVQQGAWLLFVYALGFAVPFLTVILLGKTILPHLRPLYRWLSLIQSMTGIILILAGLAIYGDLTNRWLGMLWDLF